MLRLCRRASMSGRAVSTARAMMAPTSTGLPAQRDDASRDSGDVEEIVDQPDEMLHLAIDDVAGHGRLRGWQFFQAQQLHRCSDWRKRVPQLVGQHGEELVLPPIGLLKRRRRGFEGGRPLGHAAFELRIQRLERPRLPEQLGEDTDFGPQDLGHHRHGHVIHRPTLVASQAVELRHQHG